LVSYQVQLYLPEPHLPHQALSQTACFEPCTEQSPAWLKNDALMFFDFIFFKGMCLLRKMFEHVHLKTKVGTIEDNHSRHAIEDQGCSWTTPLNNCLGLMFFYFFKFKVWF